MGRIVSNFFISLDGVVESPDKWHFDYFNDEMGEAMGRALSTVEAFLMGRVLYGEWASYWPQQDSSDPFAGMINTIPKYVVSSTLVDADWHNTTIVSGDVAAELRALKERVGGDIAMSGSATLARWLLANGLVDELNLWVHPVVVGSGQTLFDGHGQQTLTLTRGETFSTGVLDLTYAPAT